MTTVLTEAQRAAAQKLLAQEGARRRHLVVALSGAHAYGFPSPDSDLDLKSIHLEPASRLLSLSWEHVPAERIEVIDGVEVDYSSNELRDVLRGILRGNGNYLERVLGHLKLEAAPELAALQPLVRATLSRRLHRHYQGFARGQLREWERTGFTSVKKLLYVLRTTLTGTHALLTGEVFTDLHRHLDLYGFSSAHELIEQKLRGESAELPVEMAEKWRKQIGRAFEVLDAALPKSILPEEPRPRDEAALDAWQLELRKQRW
jgi:hypothetical protein